VWIPENPDGDYLAIGIYGQTIYIYPRYNIVIAKTSAYADYTKDGEDMEIESIEMFRAIARDLGSDLSDTSCRLLPEAILPNILAQCVELGAIIASGCRWEFINSYPPFKKIPSRVRSIYPWMVFYLILTQINLECRYICLLSEDLILPDFSQNIFLSSQIVCLIVRIHVNIHITTVSATVRSLTTKVPKSLILILVPSLSPFRSKSRETATIRFLQTLRKLFTFIMVTLLQCVRRYSYFVFLCPYTDGRKYLENKLLKAPLSLLIGLFLS